MQPNAVCLLVVLDFLCCCLLCLLLISLLFSACCQNGVFYRIQEWLITSLLSLDSASVLLFSHHLVSLQKPHEGEAIRSHTTHRRGNTAI